MRFSSKRAGKAASRVIALMVAFAMIITSVVVMNTVTVSAADTVTIYAEDNTLSLDSGGGFTDALIPLRMENGQVVYCFDDGILDPLGLELGGSAYEEFDASLADEFGDSDLIKNIKKLFYYGAPYDGGKGELVKWILEEGGQYNNTPFSEDDAKYYLEFMTRELIHNLTNNFHNLNITDGKYDDTGTYQILDQVIDSQTGEFINKAKEREDTGTITLYDMVAQKLWKKVIDAPAGIEDNVTFHIYTLSGSDVYNRPANTIDASKEIRQRILTAEIKPAEEEEEEEVTEVIICVKVVKTWMGGAPESLEVQLTKNGEPEGEPVTLTAEDNWSYTWGDLPQADEEGTNYEYDVTETMPEGYTQVDKKVETEEETDNITITLHNEKVEEEDVEVSFSKTDAATGEELPGAKLVVKDEAGEVVEEWTSTSEPYKVMLKPGKYTLTEITAPEGYEVAETISFEVTKDGVADGVVIMEDKAIEKQDEEKEEEKEEESKEEEKEEESKEEESEGEDEAGSTEPGKDEKEDEAAPAEDEGGATEPDNDEKDAGVAPDDDGKEAAAPADDEKEAAAPADDEKEAAAPADDEKEAVAAPDNDDKEAAAPATDDASKKADNAAPKTGDEANALGMIILLGAAATLLGGMVVRRKN